MGHLARSTSRVPLEAWQLFRSAAALIVIAGLVACGGGGGGGVSPAPGTSSPPPANPPPANPPSPDPPPANPPPVGPTATLVVTVSDRFGLPVPVRAFEHRSTSRTVTVEAAPDSTGKSVIAVPAGAGMLYVSNPLGRAQANVDLAQGSRTELALTLEPWQFAAMAVLEATVVPGSASADGRSLELSVEVSVPAQFYVYQRRRGTARRR